MANGQFGGGTGSELDPFLVEDVADLRASNKKNTFYKQVANIDLAEFSDGEGFQIIKVETSTETLSWGFDGNGYKILNLFQNKPSSHEVGLFGIPIVQRRYSDFIYRTKIKNLNMVNANITGVSAGMLGGNVYFNDNSSSTGAKNYITLENCFFSGRINSIISNNFDDNANIGLFGYLVKTSSGSTHNTMYFEMTNVMAVIEQFVTVSNCNNKIYNMGMLAPRQSRIMGHTPKYNISNSCIHSNLNIIREQSNAIVNICGISSETNNVAIVNCYTNIATTISDTSGNLEGINFNYFTSNANYVSNLIANHARGQVPGIEFDNAHYLTEEQMKDLSYYKALGWTVFE